MVTRPVSVTVTLTAVDVNADDTGFVTITVTSRYYAPLTAYLHPESVLPVAAH